MVYNLLVIIFTDNVRLKLSQRGISEEYVIETMEKPDEERPSYSTRMVRYKKFRKLYLKVVFEKEHGDFIVITTHWVEKIKL